MRMYDIIKKKRDGGVLTEEEIRTFVSGYVAGTIPDYQAAALCMAIYYRGMNPEETTALTLAVRDSGDKPDFSSIRGIRVDKHSTGGVGDKTSLVVAPVVATLGAKVAKMSGRGLGHTGGTVDKLESIPGFCTTLSKEEFERVVNEVGVAIIGQSADLAPADKKLYALRDVTATVDSLPLIASSIMGKKLAADDDCIVLDVKTGSGAFTKTRKESKKLARLLVDIGKNAGKKTLALITDMDRPLGNAIGNALEVQEAIATLNGHGPQDFTEICVILAANMLHLAGMGTVAACKKKATEVLQNGKALQTFARMVEAQGGDVRYVYDPTLFPVAECIFDVPAKQTGYLFRVDTEGYGKASVLLGAGRNTKEEKIDYAAGILLAKKTGDFVRKGETIATLYTSDASKLEEALRVFYDATVFSDEKPAEEPLVYATVK